MVRPVSSKRKLFSASKEQKENEPADGKLRAKQGEALGYPESFSVSNIGGQRKGGVIGNNNHNNSSGLGIGGCSGNVGGAGKLVEGGWGAEDVAPSTHHTPNRPVMPMSERQQIALLMQMSSPSPPDKVDLSRSSSPRTPGTPSVCRGVNKRNERGETPLHVAAIKGDTERISQLITQGADVNATDYAGWSALHEACNRGFYGVSKLLIEAGADVDAKGLDNDTPLHDACVNNHFKLVRLLLRCGAGVNVVNRRGKTPRDVCRSPGIVALIEAAARGQLQDLGTSSGDELTPQHKGSSCTSMSRRTPPANKSNEEKPGGGSGGGGGPGSPRVTLRLSNSVSRTPEKPPRPHDNKAVMENSEDVYEFKCSKDEARGGEEEEDKSAGGGSNRSEGGAGGGQQEEKADKRGREPDAEEDEEARKKRKKEDTKEGAKGVGRGGNRPAGNSEKGVKSGGRGSNSASSGVGGPKQCATGAGMASGERKSPMGSAANSPKPPSTKTGGESSDTEDDGKSESSSGAGPKVPPLKIVLGGGTEQEPNTRNGKSSSNRLPYVVNTSSGEEKEGTGDSKEGITAVKMEDQGNSNSNGSSTGSEKGSGTRITRSQRGGGSSGGGGGNSSSAEESTTVVCPTVKTEVKVEESTISSTSPDAVHPRKRKIRLKEAEPEAPPASLVDQPISNCYETFLKIRKQIERRRENLRPVQPKPPQGFKDYLMNRCSYVLAGNASSRLSVPVISPPASLCQSLKDLFNEQEKERYRLRLQHLIEKEKLVLSVEQEILRVHGRAARALANQALPFSVCTFLKDEEVYNIISPEQEKDGNARSRYNGRLFLSWLQDVDDKWDKIKENMVLRHHNEAESLHAVQKMDWEWKLKELGDLDANSKPPIDDLHVPMVHVSDDFDLLPA
ncbi:ankyrin repeat domain-containing protein 11-like isoform X3 [Penaeus japonicus]|uniref:ankyrin repeat domain-containing protein 11-like isoform X3 n=1 Tax=Penaeus japonicus TaxID=27405 RepID=UPI001C711B1D|nr:ankyrin repeat domain-containing protein 11-like isoform X3 [Penaeus japonicus]